MPYNDDFAQQMTIALEEDRKDRKILGFLLSMIVIGVVYITVLGTMMVL
ncbi:MAG: hypothetical protein IJ831_07340 [Spirochaetales bacterium]|nr:hypothetical protein [Spirochaetales bacterium]